MRGVGGWRVAAVVAMGLALSAEACGGEGGGGAASTSSSSASSSSSSSTGTGGGGGSCGAYAFGPQGFGPMCDACAATSCCAERKACAQDASCNKLIECADACGNDLACQLSKCGPLQMANPLTPAVFDLILCEQASCASACHYDQKDCQSYALIGPVSAACNTCVETKCCDALFATGQSDQLRFQKCSLECIDAPCLRDCELTFAAGLAAGDAAVLCVNGPTCGPDCNAPGMCGPLTINDPTCNTCASASCCAQLASCGFSTSCFDFLKCSETCTDVASCEACYAAWPTTTAGQGLALDNCLGGPCKGICSNGPVCGNAGQLESPTCQGCIRTSCCAEGDACGVDATCESLRVCDKLCKQDAACKVQCRTTYAAGTAAFDALALCKQTSCPTECP